MAWGGSALIHLVPRAPPMPEKPCRRRGVTKRVSHHKSGKPSNRFVPNRAGLPSLYCHAGVGLLADWAIKGSDMLMRFVRSFWCSCLRPVRPRRAIWPKRLCPLGILDWDKWCHVPRRNWPKARCHAAPAVRNGCRPWTWPLKSASRDLKADPITTWESQRADMSWPSRAFHFLPRRSLS